MMARSLSFLRNGKFASKITFPRRTIMAADGAIEQGMIVDITKLGTPTVMRGGPGGI